jgi:hypothetical protein
MLFVMRLVPFILTILLVVFSFVLSFKDVEASGEGHIWIDSERNVIQGWGWSTGANVLVTIGDDEFPIAAGEQGDFVISFTGTGYEIPSGTVVQANHLSYTATHTVTELAFDQDLDYPDGTIAKGTATPGSTVSLYLSSFGQFGREWWFDGQPVEVVADEVTGVWEYDFATQLIANGGSFEYLDLHAFQPNKETSSTFVVRTGDPGSFILGVSPQINTVWGHDWPYGDLTITVVRGSQEFVFNHGTHYGGDYRLHYDDHGLNIEVGDVVTAKIGDLEMSHQVIDLQITLIDSENDIVKGTGLPEVYVTVAIGEDNENMRYIQSDAQGIWIADFSQEAELPWGTLPVYDITAETELWVHQNIEVLGTPFQYAEGRTIITNQKNLIDLVRSFLITRLAEFAYMTSNIGEVLNNPDEDLIFESEGFGSIGFSSFYFDLLLVIDPSILNSIDELIVIAYDPVNKTLSSKVDTTYLNFLSGQAATIQFYNVAQNLGITGLTSQNIKEHLNIQVIDNGVLVTDTSEFFDWDNVVYNAQTDVLTLPVNHFTEYVLGQTAQQLPQTGMGILYIVSFGILSLTTIVVLKRYKVLV